MRTEYIRSIIIGLLMSGTIMSTGCNATTDKGEGTQPPPEVVVMVMKPESVPIMTELPGRIGAYLVAEVRPQVNGIIQKRLFVEGDDVKAGQVLYQIDTSPYKAQYAAAEASLARAEANVISIKNRVQRYSELVADNAVTQQDYDDAVAALKKAEAEILAGKAALETARINLGYTRITAPISGRIGKSNITVGALATAHQGPAFTTIQTLDPIYVDAVQSSASLLKLKRNIAAGWIKGDGPDQAQVELLLEDGTPYPAEGILKFSDVTVDPSTGSFILRMVFPNPQHTLLPGMYVRVLVREGVAENVILAPQQGVTRDTKGNPVVWLVDKQGIVQQRSITTDRAVRDKWLVTSGLKSGDRVIIEGSQRVRPGHAVKIVSADGGQKEDSAMETSAKLSAVTN